MAGFVFLSVFVPAEFFTAIALASASAFSASSAFVRCVFLREDLCTSAVDITGESAMTFSILALSENGVCTGEENCRCDTAAGDPLEFPSCALYIYVRS